MPTCLFSLVLIFKKGILWVPFLWRNQRPNPISLFYPYPMSLPLPLETECQGVGLKVNPSELGHPFDNRIRHQ